MDLEMLARQLRKPDGETGKQVGVVMNNGNKLINAWAIDALNIDKEDSVLEIGMGNGFFVKDIVAMHPQIKYTGIDYADVMVEEAKKLNDDLVKAGIAKFILGTADSLPFDDNSFKKVLTINTIYFWADATKELAEIKRVLKPQGKLVLAIRSKKAMERMPFTQFGFIKYDQRQLVDLLERNNFRIEKVVEQKEPPYEFEGQTFEIENIVVTASK